jgi:predicted RNA binding protein YcfA (HicA-like mRNA interferase family)
MARLPSVDRREAVRVFGNVGWQHDRTRGSHYIMPRPGQPGLLSVPMHSPIKRGTLRSLIRDAGLTGEEFTRLLSA